MSLYFQQVWCSGVFELRLESFKNEHGLNKEGNCCNGVRTAASYGSGFVCSSSCHTFFTVCLTHYQTFIPEEPKCTFGSYTSAVLGGNNVDFDSANFKNPIRFQFENVTWPVSNAFVFLKRILKFEPIPLIKHVELRLTQDSSSTCSFLQEISFPGV